jgi:hypothetical protein
MRRALPATASLAATFANVAAPVPADAAPSQVRGTVVRFSGNDVHVDVTIRSNHPTRRHFLSMLPLRLNLEDFAGKEKIGYLPRRLRTKGSPGSDPEDGDLIYYAPWGNLGFYYDASGIGFSRDTIHLGTYRASERRLARLTRGRVKVRVLRRGASS